jgi:hypothetical protein
MINRWGVFGPPFKNVRAKNQGKVKQMDTKTIATALGTEPRILRRFLRDPKSTFSAVGSGSRYVFTEADLPELERRFHEWAGDKQANRPAITILREKTDPMVDQRIRDEAVWAEEDPVTMEDLRDPRVRARVRAIAREWDRRLNDRLLAVGQHISQRQRRTVAA